MTIERPVLLYDHLCGRCSRFAALARVLNFGRVEFASLDSLRGEALLPDMSRYDRLAALRFLTPSGGHFTAAEATSELFAHLGATGWLWRSLRRLIPGARPAVRLAYGFAAQTRTCERL